MPSQPFISYKPSKPKWKKYLSLYINLYFDFNENKNYNNALEGGILDINLNSSMRFPCNQLWYVITAINAYCT